MNSSYLSVKDTFKNLEIYKIMIGFKRNKEKRRNLWIKIGRDVCIKGLSILDSVMYLSYKKKKSKESKGGKEFRLFKKAYWMEKQAITIMKTTITTISFLINNMRYELIISLILYVLWKLIKIKSYYTIILNLLLYYINWNQISR